MIRMLLLFFVSINALADALTEQNIPLNKIQVIGTHNSYKLFMDGRLETLASLFDRDEIEKLHYSHVSLTEQLALGLRSLEIDVLYDPQGGRYANPLGAKLVFRNMSEAFKRTMSKPGYKVLHVQDLDYNSSCLTFISCLQELRVWSENNPNHLPVIITMNIKQGASKIPWGTEALTFTEVAADALDKELTSVLGDKLITPDSVRRNAQTIIGGIAEYGWPLLSESKGKFLFALDTSTKTRKIYLSGHPRLAGRAMFANFKPGHPASAFVLKNNPVKSQQSIKDLVAKGYLVRTRADSETTEARNEDYSRMNAAFESGAQVITTDYYLPETPFNTSYKVQFKDGSFVRVKQ